MGGSGGSGGQEMGIYQDLPQGYASFDE